MVAALQRRKLNIFQWREGMLSPRTLVRGNPARAKFAAENIIEWTENDTENGLLQTSQHNITRILDLPVFLRFPSMLSLVRHISLLSPHV